MGNLVKTYLKMKMQMKTEDQKNDPGDKALKPQKALNAMEGLHRGENVPTVFPGLSSQIRISHANAKISGGNWHRTRLKRFRVKTIDQKFECLQGTPKAARIKIVKSRRIPIWLAI